MSAVEEGVSLSDIILKRNEYPFNDDNSFEENLLEVHFENSQSHKSCQAFETLIPTEVNRKDSDNTLHTLTDIYEKTNTQCH